MLFPNYLVAFPLMVLRCLPLDLLQSIMPSNDTFDDLRSNNMTKEFQMPAFDII